MAEASRNPELEAAVANDVTDVEAYKVYADWLEGQGDLLRAVLIRAQIRDVGRGGYGKEVRKLLAEHRAAFLGPLGKQDTAIEWRYGFARRIRFSERAGSDHIAHALAHPSARFVEALHLAHELTACASLLAPIRSLRELSLHAKPTTPLSVFAETLPRLRRLALRHGVVLDSASMRLLGGLRELAIWDYRRSTGRDLELELPALTDLDVHGWFEPRRCELPVLESAQLTIDSAEVLGVARWPALRRLEVRVPGPVSASAFWALCAQDLPLESLEIHGAPLGDELAQRIVAAPFACRLRTLALCQVELTDAGASLLASHRRAFPALVHLDVQDNPLGDAGRVALETMQLADLDYSRYDDAHE